MSRPIISYGGPTTNAQAEAFVKSLYASPEPQPSVPVAEAKAKPPVGYVVRNGVTVVPTKIGRQS